MPSRQWLSRGTRGRAGANSSVASHGRERRLRVPTRRTPRQGRCSGHLRLVTVRTNGPGNLARHRNPSVIHSVIGTSSRCGRFRHACPRASVAVRPRVPSPEARGIRYKKEILAVRRRKIGCRLIVHAAAPGWPRQRGCLTFEHGEREIVRSRGLLPPFRVVAGSAAADFARSARARDEAARRLRAPRLLRLSAWLWCACRRRRHGFGFRCWNGGFLGSLRTSGGSRGFVFRPAALLIFAARAARTWVVAPDSCVCLGHV
jgi:hypothetical protein